MIRWFFRNYFVRLLTGFLFLLRGYYYLYIRKAIYLGVSDLCWVYRVTGVSFLKRLALVSLGRVVEKCRNNENNIILNSYLQSRYSKASRTRYSIDGPGDLDLFRDVMVLKVHHENEKGVIVIKYGETYDAFLAYFNIEAILKKYFIVLEMSWAGACDPSYLMFIFPNNHVVVQTPEPADYLFLKELKTNIVPIELGPGDWVDSEQFHPPEGNQKKYDLVMVANWGKHKNHKKLFRALGRISGEKMVIALVGFPWGGRTKDDILREIKEELNEKSNISISIFEQLSFSETQDIVQQAKCSILLSEKEGGSKATTECLFLNVPIIIYSKHVGGSLEKVNSMTGVTSSFEGLADKIMFMSANYCTFEPRKWAIANTGSDVSTRRLNEKLKQLSCQESRAWTKDIVEKVNAPNLQYKEGHVNADLESGYTFLRSHLRH